MALKIDMTDEKGVKTRYHMVRSFTYDKTNIRVSMFSYVNQATRDSEKNIIESNLVAMEYEAELNTVKSQLQELIDKLTAGDETVREEIAILTDRLNTMTLAEDKPVYKEPIDTHYSEVEITMPYLEPLSLEALYIKLTESGIYAGAELI